MALVEMAQNMRMLPIRLLEISMAQGIDVGYLEQIFAKLKKAKLVISVKGRKGGYVLAKKSVDIKLGDIVFAVGENVKMTRCHGDGIGCMRGGAMCMTHSLWVGLEQHIKAYLDMFTLSDICKMRAMCGKEISYGVQR